MSFLSGSLAGALVAGGVYYGFSNLIQSRTQAHRADLHDLSRRLLNPPAALNAPPPAAERIHHDAFSTQLKDRWNHEIEGLFRTSTELAAKGRDWAKRTLYGASGGKEKF
ncbi:hypothetical protein GLOTRDRAFT_110285 [Gloeophyllum trabeum ATCC 11539]|uniref:MICOS complex subunit MIC12 n=1 Tax=Gloeophyllum trabeum (strain ATCC 11539 / FP-39264 / Madison 617) TaxID=670483 RepID=S7QFL7_GLOTA|nr:uncharacterized protein GLOTRDRAFT_110285 [Gloeophyllum trabeum ATCC 11539]EPQ58636.1 hypothetical protein GLOTRDRAFT_110285 [Gloeophyllum trabeum ATCC 11539]